MAALQLKIDVKLTIDSMEEVVKRLREMSPLYELVQEGVDLSTIKLDSTLIFFKGVKWHIVKKF